MTGRDKPPILSGFLTTFLAPSRTAHEKASARDQNELGQPRGVLEEFPLVKAVDDPSSPAGVRLFLQGGPDELVPIEEVASENLPREVVVDASGGVRFAALLEALGAAGIEWAGLPVGEAGDVLNGIPIPEPDVLQRILPKWTMEERIETPEVRRSYKKHVRTAIGGALNATSGNVSAAARLLEVGPKFESSSPDDEEAEDHEESMLWSVAHEALAAAAIKAQHLNETLSLALKELEGLGRGAVR